MNHGGGNDRIDLDARHSTDALSLEIDFLEDAKSQYDPQDVPRSTETGKYQVWQTNYLVPRMGDRDDGDGTEGGYLGVRWGDGVPSFFLTNLDNKGLLPVSPQNSYGDSSRI